LPTRQIIILSSQLRAGGARSECHNLEKLN
jgi:hypothetical protein